MYQRTGRESSIIRLLMDTNLELNKSLVIQYIMQNIGY